MRASSINVMRGPCLRCVMNRSRPMGERRGGGGVFKIYEEPKSPHEEHV